MQSISSISSSSSKKRRGASRRAIAGRSLLGAALLASTALIALPAGPAFADDLVVDGQDREVINKPVDLDGGNVFVGVDDGDDATLTIANGGELESYYGYIGLIAGSKGTVTVSRGGSWNADGAIYVGVYGEGTLNVSSGGFVESYQDFVIGYGEVSTGTVTVSGKGSRLIAGDDVLVGSRGEGTLNVLDGGYVYAADDVRIGDADGGTGTVTVSGKDSQLIAGDDIIVGRNSEGTLNVRDGGYVRADGNVYMGAYSGSTGTVTVSGKDSRLVAGDDITVGNYGEGTLNVLDGGYVHADDDVYLGRFSGSTGTVTVSGKDSRLVAGDRMLVGYYGEGSLNVLHGGYVRADDDVRIGQGFGSTGTVTVSGNDSRLVAGDVVFVGYFSEGTLTVASGGVVEARDSFIIAYGADSEDAKGTLNIGAASGEKAQAAGFLQGADGAAATIEFFDGDGTIVFNHTG
ncbi:hypothetical protein E2A64_17725, partial [Pseudohoeflea suaedae]